MKQRLSALVVAHNEEEQLADCLATLTFADEIVVILDRCTDRSRDIAEKFNTRILEGAWEIEGLRRNQGIETTTGDWILEVDADERVTPALAAEIRHRISMAPFGYFLIPYDNYVGRRLIRYGWGAQWGVSATVRLFARGAKHWGEERVHPKVTLKGERQWLHERMVHYVDRNLSDMIYRFDRYTTARAQDLRSLKARGQDIGTFRGNLRRVFSRFLKCYFSRKGYREGAWGFTIALFAGLYPLISYLKATLEPDEGNPEPKA
ncbi:MAG: glycosyltransferase family 2 protein [Alphaproteobacteria bacterium]